MLCGYVYAGFVCCVLFVHVCMYVCMYVFMYVCGSVSHNMLSKQGTHE